MEDLTAVEASAVDSLADTGVPEMGEPPEPPVSTGRWRGSAECWRLSWGIVSKDEVGCLDEADLDFPNTLFELALAQSVFGGEHLAGVFVVVGLLFYLDVVLVVGVAVHVVLAALLLAVFLSVTGEVLGACCGVERLQGAEV